MMSSPVAIATRPVFVSSTAFTPVPSTLVVIDSKVSEYQRLAASVLPDVSVVVLDGNSLEERLRQQDGVNPITAILQRHPHVKTLHIVAHGAPGVVYVGNTPLNLASLDRDARELQSWALESLFIYGCQVAAGDAGAEFLHKLHRLTGAAIAASTTKTGSAALGGNWQLEVAIGNLKPSLVFSQATQQQYGWLLELLNADDYAALKALYQNTDGANWSNNTGWRDWDFSSTTPPELSVVSQWTGVALTGDRVQDLSLLGNNLTGTIPTELSNLSNLRLLNLGVNALSGTIPVELSNLSSLTYLNLGTNNLSGTVPSELSNLNNVSDLYLDTNQLGGEIPAALLSKLNNQISFYNLDNVPYISTVADQYTSQDQALTLDLSISDIDKGSNDANLSLGVSSDNTALIDSNAISVSGTGGDRTIIFTPIAGQSGTATITLTLDGDGEQSTKTFTLTVYPLLNAQDYAALKALYFSTNGGNWANNSGWKDWDFNSDTPPASNVVSQWKGVLLDGDRVRRLNLSGNQLSGTIPSELGNLSELRILNLYNNQLSGSIPTELGNLSKLETLGLYTNQLSGTIPNTLDNLSQLSFLNLRDNQLSGSIPTELGGLSSLTTLNLSSNQLSGNIPVALSNLSKLLNFNLRSNQLSGSIPPELGNLSNLVNLNLFSNQLSGSIPPELGNLSNLVNLNLYTNQLSGSIPSELGNLSNLMVLYLYENQLSGSIPPELGNLSNLNWLALLDNQLSGSIPVELGNLSNLTYFDLQNNQLSGSIPTELGNLNNLIEIYLNNNQLSGDVPQALVSKLGNSITGYDLDNLPFVTAIADQATTTDKPLTLSLSVSDLDTAGNSDPALLTIAATSDNPTLIGASGILISGTGSDRVLTLTPTAGHTGTATITLTLQDTSGEKTEKTFTVTVNLGSTVTSLFDATLGEFVVSDALLGLNPETLGSGELFQLRNGTAKANTLRGKNRNDAIFGRKKDDQIVGRGGSDFLSGGKENDIIDGGAGNDLIFGDSGNDLLVGGSGNDILIGSLGGDRITTGSGTDKVCFSQLNSAKQADTLTDFNVKTDLIVVSANGFGGDLIAASSINTEQFHIGKKAVGSEDRFIYNRNTGDLFFDADGSGAGKAIAFTHLKTGLSLSSQNISVV